MHFIDWFAAFAVLSLDPISANLFVANLTRILYKYGACLEAMQPTRTGIYCYRFFLRIG
jgi:hypothetical protein